MTGVADKKRRFETGDQKAFRFSRGSDVDMTSLQRPVASILAGVSWACAGATPLA